jgi:sugar lactone lactonase YvrE
MPIRHFVAAAVLSFPLLCHAGFSNGQAATYVLGQPDFTTSEAAPTSSRYWGARDVAVDARSGKAFVIDVWASRILRYSNVDALALGAAPEAVLGQTSLNVGGSGTSASQLNTPYGLALDATGALWVADTNNNRVVRFADALTCASGAPANLALGQPDFTSNGATASSSGMNAPKALHLDANGTLWVADTGNNRVLRFANAAGKAPGASADGELGQPDFTTNATGSGPSGMNAPSGVCADAAGHLFVADTINSRVLRFDSAATKADADGAPADHVLGQPTLSGGYSSVSSQRLNSPENLSLDSAGTLAIADTNNRRCLLWADAAAKGDFAAATTVLGQSDFDSQGGGLTAARFSDPSSAKFDAAGRLWLIDGSARRVLRFDPSALLGGNFKPQVTSAHLRRSAVFTITNFGEMPARFALAAVVKARGKARIRARWLLDGENTTAALRSGTAVSRMLNQGESATLICKPLRLDKGARKLAVKIRLTATSVNYPTLSAVGGTRLRL